MAYRILNCPHCQNPGIVLDAEIYWLPTNIPSGYNEQRIISDTCTLCGRQVYVSMNLTLTVHAEAP